MVIGIDGMDPKLLRRFVAEGEMPTFKKLMEQGHFSELQTTMPPQSPVAWSSFISGTNPGGHGIFDFVHRDPKTFAPYLSTSRSYPAEKVVNIGGWEIPLKSGHVDLLRRGPAFWSVLEQNGIPASLYCLPANFPVQLGGATKAMSGMGTPDLLGTYGTFTYFTDAVVPDADKFTGGRVVNVRPKNNLIQCVLEGPKNSMRSDGRSTALEFTVRRDPWAASAKVDIQGTDLVLTEGEWSEWIPIKYELMPMFAGVSGMVRLYLQQVRPEFRLYVSPINVDPMDPGLPICNPGGYSKELSEAVGRFTTLGFPEDTKALSHGVFTEDEFLGLSRHLLDERLAGYEYQLRNFKEGLFFYYFSSIDQNSHMLWKNMDVNHPLYQPGASEQTKGAIKYFYRRMEEVLKMALAKTDSRTTLMIMSDHGFAPFYREFNLSTWLVKNGFTALTDPSRMESMKYFDVVNWSKTKAYAMGINGIYINMAGRDKFGSVPPAQAAKVKREIIARLAQERDPQNGQPVIVGAYDTHKIYSGPFLAVAPDIVVGYQSGYRISDESVLGKFPKDLFSNRTDKWAADHCMDSSVVPGVLLSNKKVSAQKPGIWDLGPTIIKAFGLEVPKEMDGKPIFGV